MMGSAHTYDLAAAGAAGGRPGAPGGPPAGGAQRADIEVALNPEELDLDPAEMAARYEQGVREQQSHLAKDRHVSETFIPLLRSHLWGNKFVTGFCLAPARAHKPLFQIYQ